MMKTTTALFLILSNVSLETACGFATPRAVHHPIQTTTRTTERTIRTALGVGLSGLTETEEDARFILSKAKECAYDTNDSFNADDAEILLREMLHMQSGCVTGTLIGHDLCEEQDVAADIVAHLRAKINSQRTKQQQGKPVPHKSTESLVPWVASELALGAMMLVVAIFWTTLDMTSQDTSSVALTAGEWWSAIQNGYLIHLMSW